MPARAFKTSLSTGHGLKNPAPAFSAEIANALLTGQGP